MHNQISRETKSKTETGASHPSNYIICNDEIFISQIFTCYFFYERYCSCQFTAENVDLNDMPLVFGNFPISVTGGDDDISINRHFARSFPPSWGPFFRHFIRNCGKQIIFFCKKISLSICLSFHFTLGGSKIFSFFPFRVALWANFPLFLCERCYCPYEILWGPRTPKRPIVRRY